MPSGPDADRATGAPEHLAVRLEGAAGTDARSTVSAEFTAFVAAASAELGRVAWYLTGDAVRAEDLLQTTLLRTYLHWSRASRVEAGPMAYARRVMMNARTDTWRALRREHLVAPADLPDAAAPGELGQVQAERDLLARALATLTPRQRRIVVLRHLVGLPAAEVAAELGVSVGTVKSVASRGLAQLRVVLADDGAPGAPGTRTVPTSPPSRTPSAPGRPR